MLTESAHSSTVGRRLYHKQNVDFLLGESGVVVDIPDDDAPKLSEGMDEEATKLPREPKKELDDATNPGDGFSGNSRRVGFKLLLILPRLQQRIVLLQVLLLCLWRPLASAFKNGGSIRSPFLCNILLRMNGVFMHSLLLPLKPWSSSSTLICPTVFYTQHLMLLLTWWPLPDAPARLIQIQ